MKLFLVLLILNASFLVNAQSLDENGHEELVNFTSTLIDYEIHNDNVVALTRKNKEYFIYFTDSEGAKLFEAFDIFFPTDLEIDCMGNLFVVGVDSAVQIKITDYIVRVQTLGAATYQNNIQSCRALFKESLVRTSVNNSLIYEPIDDSIFAQHPVLFTIQIWSDEVRRASVNSPNPPSASLKDPILRDDRNINIANDVLTTPSPARRRSTVDTRRSYGVASELSAFQVGESLWVVDETNELLFVYDQYGKTDGQKTIKGLRTDFKLTQDLSTQDLFFILSNGGMRIIRQVDENGKLINETEFQKGLLRSSLKISNGYLYFRDAKGAGESIKRVSLN